MKQIIFSLSVSAFVLVGCGGGGGNSSTPASNNVASSVVSSSPSSVPSTVASTSSSLSSSISLSSSPMSSSVISSSPSSVASTVASTSSSRSSSISSSSPMSSIASSSTQASSVASSIPFTLISNSFKSGENIPVKYACYGTEISPHLKWEITSDAVKSFALIVEDFDAIALVGYPYVHWDVYNIPADVREIAEGATLHMPTGSVEGANDDGVAKYSGPCPPEGTGTHHYFFTLYALNKANITVNLNHSLKRSEFEAQYASSIVQKVEMTGLYTYK